MAEIEALAIDADDVLFRHAHYFCEWSNTEFGTALQVHEYHEDWPTLWDVDYEEALRRRNIFLSPEVIGQLEPVDSMYEALKILQDTGRFRFDCVTKRRTNLTEVTRAGLDLYYPGIFSELVCATILHPDGSRTSESKADICARLGSSALLDDQWQTCFEVAQSGIDGLLYGDYGWHRPVPVKGVYEIPNPAKLVEHFNGSR